MQRASHFLIFAAVPIIAVALSVACAASARAQFGGYQQMTIDKIRQRQAADARQLGRGGPVQSSPTPQPSVTRNFYYSPYFYNHYSYNDFGWGGPLNPGYNYYGGWPQPYYAQPAPVFVQPQVHVNPIIVQPPAAQPPAAPPGAAVRGNPAAMANEDAPPEGVPTAEDEIVRRVSVLRASSEAGRTRADILIAEGDREFAAQQYRRAASKYREAIGRAPDYAAAHLRAGHAYTATGDFELAVTYFAMGFELARTAERAGFSLEALYRGNRLAKEEHMESLADAALRQPGQGGLLFLTAVALHYDGKPLQARDYFRRAAEMPGRHRPYAALFLPAPPAQQDAGGHAGEEERLIRDGQ